MHLLYYNIVSLANKLNIIPKEFRVIITVFCITQLFKLATFIYSIYKGRVLLIIIFSVV